MQIVLRILGGILSVYSILLIIRIMLTWFHGVSLGRAQELLCAICDPYLDWFRRFRFLRLGMLDLSPVAAFIILSIAGGVLFTAAQTGNITIAFVLLLILEAVWSAARILLGFFIIIVGLRLAAYIARANIFHTFWQLIVSFCEPLLFQTSRIFFRRKKNAFAECLVLTLVLLVGIFVLLNLGVNLLRSLLLPPPAIF